MTPAAIPENYRDLFTKEALAHLATVRTDGAPQSTSVWVDFDGTHVRFEDAYPFRRPGEIRVIVTITPEKIQG